MSISKLKEPLDKVLSKKFIKFYCMCSGGITALLVLLVFIGGTPLDFSEFTQIILTMLCIFIVIYIAFAIIYIIASFIDATLFSPTRQTSKVERVVHKTIYLFESTVSGIFKIIFFLVILGIVIYLIYFIGGGLLGLLKFGWKNM